MNIIYNTKHQLEEIINKISPDKIFKDVHDEINRYIINRLPYPNITQENYDPQVIVEHLTNLRKLIEEKSKQVSNIFSYYEWLYHLRRLPPIFFKGQLETTYSYDMALALHIASFSENKTTNISNNINLQKFGINADHNRKISLTKQKIKYIFRFISHIKFLSHIDVLIRLSSKGVQLIKESKYQGLPMVIPPKNN